MQNVLISSEDQIYIEKFKLNKETLSEVSDHHFFLTYQRSGTNLLIASYQYFFKQHFLHFNHAKHSFDLGTNRLNLKLNLSKNPIYRTHNSNDLYALNTSKNSLIFILRDFHECILRQYIRDMIIEDKNGFSNPSIESFYDNCDLISILKSNHWVKFKANLELFDSWNQEQKFLINYEDLVQDLPGEIKKLALFLKESTDEIEKFEIISLNKNKIDDLKYEILNSYDREMYSIGGSMSKGSDLKYHSKKIPKQILTSFDHYVQEDCPSLWEKYLKKYATKN